MAPRSEPRAPIHTQEDVCDFLLERLVSKAPLEIRESGIPGAGSGLFTTTDLDAGRQIFVTTPIVAAVADGFEQSVCDNCYNTRFRRVQADGSLCLDTDAPVVQYIPCPECKKCYYCSNVRDDGYIAPALTFDSDA